MAPKLQQGDAKLGWKKTMFIHITVPMLTAHRAFPWGGKLSTVQEKNQRCREVTGKSGESCGYPSRPVPWHEEGARCWPLARKARQSRGAQSATASPAGCWDPGTLSLPVRRWMGFNTSLEV